MNADCPDRERLAIVDDLRSSDEEIRRLAVERLLGLPESDSIPSLVQALGDESWRVRKATVGRLLVCDDWQRIVGELIGALADGENTGRRNSAVEALIEIGSKATPALVHALESEDVDVRKLVVDAIAGVGDELAHDSIIPVLRDPDPNVRGAAADALGQLGGEGVAEALRDCAIDDQEDRLVRLSALRSLSRLEWPLSIRDLGSVLDDSVLSPAGLTLLGYCNGPDAIEALLKGLGTGSRSSREAAMEALLRILSQSDDSAADQLIEGIRQTAATSDELISTSLERLYEADLSTRLVLIQFLGLVADPKSVIPILEAGRDEAIAEVAHGTLEAMDELTEGVLDEHWGELDVELRRAACALLGRTRGERGTARLLESLEDFDSELRAASARALGARRCAQALPAFVHRLEIAALEDEDFEVEEELQALVDALVNLASPDHPDGDSITAEAVDLLSARLDGAAETVRLSIATVLGRIGRHEDSELVSSLLKDPSAQVRRAAVESLSRLEPGTASEPLRLALADESPVVRVAAAAALGGSESLQVLDDLQRLLQDDDVRVCAAAVRAIGAQCSRVPDTAARSDAVALIDRALGADGMIAMAAIEALRCIGDSSAAKAAVQALDRPEPELVQAAVSCIAQHGDPEVVRELVSLVAHPSWGVRADVIQTLADRRVVQAIPPILRLLETEQDGFVRDTILRALKRLEA